MTFSDSVLKWYDQNKRILPWRSFTNPNPYFVWLSEMMLQQTTVPTVIPYFERFTKKWPQLKDIASASEEDILVEWQGLGYYARARNLLKCAQILVNEYGGRFPNSSTDLQKLPGIGSYSAAAIAAIAFNSPETVVDGNIVRIISRVGAIRTPYPKSKTEIHAIASDLTPNNRPGCYAQALMDLSSSICRPKNPKCNICPLASYCSAFKRGNAEIFPIKEPKKAKPVKACKAIILKDTEGCILLRKRPSKGLLANMWEVPTTEWLMKSEDDQHPTESTHLYDKAQNMGNIKHTFTHFHLEVEVFASIVDTYKCKVNEKWVSLDALNEAPLPTLMKKVIKTGIQT